MKEKVEEGKELVRIPELYSKDVVMESEQAVTILKDLGFKVSTFPIREADIKYKDCFASQVVNSKPKHNKRVTLEKYIYVYFVTAEIIEENKQLFEKMMCNKATVKTERAAKVLKLKNKNLQVVNSVVFTIRKKTNINKNESQNKQDN